MTATQAVAAPAKCETRCVHAKAELDRAPSLGETARISFEVTSDVDLKGVRIDADVPGIARWSTVPDGMSARDVASSVPTDFEKVGRATTTTDLSAGQTVRFQGAVQAVATGTLLISVRAVAPVNPELNSDTFVAAATIGADGKSSYLGSRAETGATQQIPAGVASTRATPWLAPAVAPAAQQRKPHSDDPPRAQAAPVCATGSWNYRDHTGTFRTSANFVVEAWDDDNGPDDLLGVALTDGNGAFRLCFPNDDFSGGADVYLKFVAQNGSWGVEFDDDPYNFRTATMNDVGDGRTLPFGAQQPTDPRYMRAVEAFDQINSASDWTPSDCWDADDHDCRRVDFNWRWDYNPANNHYLPNSDEVHLRANAPDFRSIVVHELGHAVMDDVYNDNFPNANCPSPHFINGESGASCAWSEGFPDWYQAAVFNDHEYRGDGFTVELENVTWGEPNWANGDGVEGRVAGALLDLADAHNEPHWDARTENPYTEIWQTFLRFRSSTFAEFWRQRGQAGFDVGPGPLAALYQNTIDYGFREPLGDYQTRTRPAPLQNQPHRYRVDTSVAFWSVVAIRPPANADYDLRLYDDPELRQLLAVSVAGQGEVDFIAIDTNQGGRPAGDFYPEVTHVNGTGDYRIQFANGANLLRPEEKFTMGDDNVVVARDHCVEAGTKFTVTATPDNASQDAQLFVMSSDGSRPVIASRAQAAASSTGHGPGEAEQVEFTAPGPALDCYSVVLVNKAGNGTYTLSVS
ncbi:hypothetical protein G7043_26790 [Lentzea sp. NEAU-D13]|uniref:Uncharacterized protein n=1 Tax=Lentzea alba TaxID=2714351 RepID=A0A7C9VUB0_9PSEU|nr:hypothetical protein [Lentzea alba]NGY62535.1 hypothetical protein [Lentzea alba]